MDLDEMASTGRVDFLCLLRVGFFGWCSSHFRFGKLEDYFSKMDGEFTDFLATLRVDRVDSVLWLLELGLIDGVHVRWEDCFRQEEEEE